jgi:membrane protease YdiL (CAAX protease family)
MRRAYRFAGDHPLAFALLALLLWLTVTAAAVILISLLFSSLDAIVVQSTGTLAATALLLAVCWRFGWLRPAGITSPGSWQVWLYALAALVYLVLVYWLVFFGDISFELWLFSRVEEVGRIVLRQVVVGLVEEIVFRGVILYVLVRVWEKSRRGLAAGVLLSAFLFGALHLLQGFAGRSFGSALLVSLESFVNGIWWGAIVLLGVSIWPTVILHAIANLSILIRLLAVPGFALPGAGFILASLLQLPLIVVFMWLLLRTFPRPEMPESPRFAVET